MLVIIVQKPNYIVWCTVQDPAELFQSQKGDVVSFSESVQCAVVDSLFHQPVLGKSAGFHGIPQRTVIDHAHTSSPVIVTVSSNYMREWRKTILCIYSPYYMAMDLSGERRIE